MPRKGPPPGYCTAGQAMGILGNKMLYKYIDKGLIHPHELKTPDGKLISKHKFYLISEVEAVRDAEQSFYDAEHNEPLPTNPIEPAIFAVATPDDMDALYTMAVKLFPRTANAKIRRSWLRKEKRGHFVVKRVSDGAVMCYLYILPFLPKHLADYLHDELPSRDIKPRHISPFVPGQPAQAVVFGGIGSDPDLDTESRKIYTAVLLRGVRDELCKLGEQGIIIPRIYAFSERTEGIAMCVRLGMEQWEPPHGKWCTFQIDVMSARNPLFKGYRQALAEWRANHES